MPSRISLPKLSLFSSRNSSPSPDSKPQPPPPPPPTPTPTQTTSPKTSPRTSASASSTPTSPPARLHLRSILPVSPEAAPIMPPPPRTPRAWVWQCHRCLNVYRLGCTRRCLDCSHTYCVGNATSSKQTTRGKKRRRTQGAICGAEFDYIGWEQWGSWRRKVLGHEAAGRCDPAARDRAFLRRRHDCWIDCDSPSECCHRRFELAAELLRDLRDGALVAPAAPVDSEPEPEPAQPPVIVGSPPASPDEDISFEEVLAVETAGEGKGEEEPVPKSPLGQSSFLWIDDENETDTSSEEEEEEQWLAAAQHIEDTRDGTTIALEEDPDSDCDSDGSGFWSLSSSDSDSSSEENTAAKTASEGS
ncbi:hypothetical protein F4777DRAFT_601125 [Nemania sp. FL0916]|nr:hypothetical protein F4777DRAFT_601125 [Nemania sp. FL0916]